MKSVRIEVFVPLMSLLANWWAKYCLQRRLEGYRANLRYTKRKIEELKNSEAWLHDAIGETVELINQDHESQDRYLKLIAKSRAEKKNRRTMRQDIEVTV